MKLNGIITDYFHSKVRYGNTIMVNSFPMLKRVKSLQPKEPERYSSFKRVGNNNSM